MAEQKDDIADYYSDIVLRHVRVLHNARANGINGVCGVCKTKNCVDCDLPKLFTKIFTDTNVGTMEESK
jgi:hypothetical protein